MSTFGQRSGVAHVAPWTVVGLAMALIALGSVDGLGQQTADLSIEKTAPSEAFVDNEFDYALDVTNSGPDAADNVTVTDRLPSAVTFVASTADCVDAGESTYECNVGTIGPDETISMTITVAADASGTSVENDATVASDQHDGNSADNAAAATTTLKRRATSTTITGCGGPLPVNATGTCTVEITDTAPGNTSVPNGDVTFTVSTGNATFENLSCSDDGSDTLTCTVDFTPTSVATHTVTAAYAPGGTSADVHEASQQSLDVEATQRTTSTEVHCDLDAEAALVNQPITCRASVTDTAGEGAVAPQGTVNFGSSAAGGDASFSEPSCTLTAESDATSGCSVTYTRTRIATTDQDGTADGITAAYGASEAHRASDGVATLPVVKRPTSVSVDCTSGTTAQCTVSVQDEGTAGFPAPPTGVVEDAVNGATCTLSGGQCALSMDLSDVLFTYLMAEYNGSDTHLFSAGWGRAENPTKMNEFESIALSAYMSNEGELSDLEESIFKDTLRLIRARNATYAGRERPRNHDQAGNAHVPMLVLSQLGGSEDDYPATRDAIADLLAPLLTVCQPVAELAQQGLETVFEGIRTAINETFDAVDQVISVALDLADEINNFLNACIVCVDLIGDIRVNDIPFIGEVFSGIADAITAVFGGIRAVFDQVRTLLGQLVTRAGQTTENVLGLCLDDNPANGIPDTFDRGNVLVMQSDIDIICNGMNALLDVSDVVIDAIASATLVELANVVLVPVVAVIDQLVNAFCVEGFDGQGLNPWLEAAVGLNPFAADTDGDFLPDATELDMANGRMAAFLRDIDPEVFPCPSPLDPDSDGDGITDFGEDIRNVTKCATDSDGDGVNDGVELSTHEEPDFENRLQRTWVCKPIDTGSCQGQLNQPDFDPEFGPGPDTFFRGFDDPRMRANPLVFDTDGDGLPDRQEIGKACDSDEEFATQGPIINDADSDGDGLLDGDEKPATRNPWSEALGEIQLGDSRTSGTGWTDPCSSDTDGDGLSDAEEVDLWGTSVEATTPFGTTTSPALDDDMDRDGLSDAEEQRVTQTDPIHADTDGDTIVDANELIATGGSWPERTFRQETDPLTPDTDADGIPDNVEWDPTVAWDSTDLSATLDVGTGLGDPDAAAFRDTGGQPDGACPHADNSDSDGDGLLDGDEVSPAEIAMNTTDNGYWSTSFTQIEIGDRDSSGSGWTNPCNPDTDGDGLSDAEEIDLWGADPVEATTPFGTSTVPALDEDSDRDRLSDYEEVNATGTDALHADTDGDTILDANELIASGGAWPDRSFHQVSDPLTRDTDSDDLPDNYEWDPTVDWDSTDISGALDVGTGLGDPSRPGGFAGEADSVCPRVDKPDTDGDALLDGDEISVQLIRDNFDDIQAQGDVWAEEFDAIVVGDSISSGKGWTDPCNPDTDADRLSDGIEVGTWGEETESTAPELSADGQRTVGTVPALDDDIDQDGLSDFEESNTIGTDALHADTDGDRITDANELIATGGSFPARSFRQESNPQSRNSDDDQMLDDVEWIDAAEGLPALDNTSGTGVGDLSSSAFRVLGGVEDTVCPFVDNGDSDEDGVIDGLVLTLSVSTATSQFKPAGTTEVTFDEGFDPVDHGSGRLGVPAENDGHINDLAPGADARGGPGTEENVCNRDSDGDGLADGAESQLGSDPGDWDTDNDGLPDNEGDGVFGQVPATNPLDPDSDDDGLIDGTEILGELNPAAAPLDAFVSNPTSPDTDNDGLCDGGEPARVANNLTVLSSECTAGIFDHPNDGSTPGIKLGLGEDEDGDGVIDPGETSPLMPDTDEDGVVDGVEKLGFSVDRQGQIPDTDARGRDTRVSYPDPGCLDPLDPDTDRDGLLDGEEDVNGNGHIDFEPSDFDWADLVGIEMAPAEPPETDPCNPDTDDDSQPGSLNGFGAAGGNSSDAEERERGTNPLDFDSDNDLIDDGVEVAFQCVAPSPESGFTFTTVPDLDPLDRDSDSDGIIDGLENADGDAQYDPDTGETNPCASPPIPVVDPPGGAGGGRSGAEDTDGDGFPDEAERNAGTDPNDPNDEPDAFFADLDLDGREDNLVWLEDEDGDGVVDSVAIDMDGDRQADERIDVVTDRDLDRDDFNDDGQEDCRYRVAYAVGEDQRVLATLYDFGCDLSIDEVELEELD